MNIRNSIIAFFNTILALTSIANADVIIIDNIKFQGSPGTILECRKANKKFEKARKNFHEIEKKYYPPQLQSPEEFNRTGGHDDKYAEEYKKAQAEYASARQRILALELKLNVVPTNLSNNNAFDLNDKLKWKIFSEAEKINEKLCHVKKMGLKEKEYNIFLNKMLSNYRNHPAEGIILVELGKEYKSSPQVAYKYFNETLKCKFPSDLWDWAKQDACKKLARLHEKRNEYEKAIVFLKQWKISEPCGTGAGASRVEKKFWIWRLSAHVKGFEQVRKEMWKDIVEAKITRDFIGENRLTELILSLYKSKDARLFSKDIDRAIMKVSNSIPDDEYAKLRKADVLKFLNILKKNKI